jgi:hypothetical protein
MVYLYHTMNDEQAVYEQIRDLGATPHEVARQGLAAGLGMIWTIRLLRGVFSLDVAQAKEVVLQATGAASSLSEYQETLLPVLQQLLESGDQDEKR